jgi:hypothetical protein
MHDDDVWGGEMPNLPFWRRHNDQTDAEQLDQLLDAGQFDMGATVANPEWQSVSDVLRSAAAATEPSELAGETATLDTFRAAFRREHVGIRHRRPQPIARYKTVLANRFSTLLPGRIAVGLAAGVVTLTGAATAAYACVLPAPIQSFAHTTIGAPRPSDPKLSIAAVDAAKHYPTPSVSASPSPTPSVSVSAASVTASVTPTPSPSKSPAPKITKKPVLDPTQLAAVEALVDYHLCQSYTTLTKIGKTLDPKALALLAKAAGSSTPATIAAYCAALPVPPNPCLAQPVPTASATPSATPNTKDDKKLRDDGWWRWCGVCPKATASPTASATATATPGASSLHRFPFPWFWCGDRDPLASHSAKPTPTVKPTPTKSPFPGNWWGGGWGFGKGGPGSNGQGGNGQGGNGQVGSGPGTGGGQRDGTPVHAIQGADNLSGKNTGQRH